MYCIACGAHLADTEQKCPLCGTVVYHPTLTQKSEPALYPPRKMPPTSSGRAFLGGAILILFMIPLIITFFSDIQPDGAVDWFGYVAGGMVIAYLTFALPMWFEHPNPVIFLPCDFAACGGYLFYVAFLTDSAWFWSFALPVLLGIAIISCTLVTLLRYLRRGRLYAIGGSVMALGAWIFSIELLMDHAFALPFIGWSLYPLISLLLMGGLLIYLAMNSTAREKIERRLFF